MSFHKKLYILYIYVLIFCPVALKAQNKNFHRQKNIISLNKLDDGKKTTIFKGQSLILTLPESVNGGYRFNNAVYDRKFLVLNEKSQNSPPINGPLGHPAQSIWHFKAIKSGKTQITITESRPWGKRDSLLVWASLVLIK